MKEAQDVPIARASGIRLPMYFPPCTATMVASLCSWFSSTAGKPKIGGGGRGTLDLTLS